VIHEVLGKILAKPDCAGRRYTEVANGFISAWEKKRTDGVFETVNDLSRSQVFGATSRDADDAVHKVLAVKWCGHLTRVALLPQFGEQKGGFGR